MPSATRQQQLDGYGKGARRRSLGYGGKKKGRTSQRYSSSSSSSSSSRSSSTSKSTKKDISHFFSDSDNSDDDDDDDDAMFSNPLLAINRIAQRAEADITRIDGDTSMSVSVSRSNAAYEGLRRGDDKAR
jgi:hypothetical protein